MQNAQLTVLPSVIVGMESDGSYVLPRKLVNGLRAYVDAWNGPVVVIMRAGKVADNLDNDLYAVDSLPFRLAVVDDPTPELKKSSVILATAVADQFYLAPLCKRLGIPLVYITELNLRTRLQIMRSGTRNPILRLRRELWNFLHERELVKALRYAQGVQCNGTPTYEAYKNINPNPLLFFDTRSNSDALITEADLKRRLSHRRTGGKLRLAFSGRLVAIKGVDDLLLVAKHLQELSVPFELSIFGDGDRGDAIRKQIGNLPIQMNGVLDFESELQPLMKATVDLFVCCHKQGDPSCTYLETLALGIPIIGYDNDAFVGVQRASGAGWIVPMGKPQEMALFIKQLTVEQIEAASLKSLQFASKHTFKSEFDRRIAHLGAISKSKALIEGAI